MSDIKLLNKSFNIADVRHVPAFLEPYTFVISMPHRLTLICEEDATPDDVISEIEHCSCFVLEEDSTAELLALTNTVTSLLTNANIGVHMMTSDNSMYIFVGTDDAMPAVMLLSNNGYDIVYSDLI